MTRVKEDIVLELSDIVDRISTIAEDNHDKLGERRAVKLIRIAAMLDGLVDSLE
mgnify:CR=1 FL=1